MTKSKSARILATLVVALALGAVASASASAALPEFVPGEGAKFPIAVKYSEAASSHIENTGGSRWTTCTATTVTGNITAAKAASLTLAFTGCKANLEGSCHTSGAPEGQETLSGTGSLVYIKKTTKQVGLLLAVSATKILCGNVTINVRGSIVIPVTPINTLTSALTIIVHGTNGKSEFRSYENEKGETKGAHLETNIGVGYEESCLFVEGQSRLATSSPLTIFA
jgi:hypothetical protein